MEMIATSIAAMRSIASEAEHVVGIEHTISRLRPFAGILLHHLLGKLFLFG
jgi:hypothetical protein